MGIKQYWTKTKEFVKNLFGYKEKINNKIFDEKLISIYNNFMSSLERLYLEFSGQRLQFQPISSVKTNYESLFSENTGKEFNIYQTDKGLKLVRKNLEGYL